MDVLQPASWKVVMYLRSGRRLSARTLVSKNGPGHRGTPHLPLNKGVGGPFKDRSGITETLTSLSTSTTIVCAGAFTVTVRVSSTTDRVRAASFSPCTTSAGTRVIPGEAAVSHDRVVRGVRDMAYVSMLAASAVSSMGSSARGRGISARACRGRGPESGASSSRFQVDMAGLKRMDSR
jgi:hypothetical protein